MVYSAGSSRSSLPRQSRPRYSWHISQLAIALALAVLLGAYAPKLIAQERFAPSPDGASSDTSVLGAAIPSVAASPSPTLADLSPEEAGDLDMAHKHYQAAIAAYHQAPLDNAKIWNKIGIANQQMFILSEAQKSYENSLKLNPRDPEVINNLATVYYSLKQYNKAEVLYRKAIKLDPKSAIIYKNLGTAYLAENRVKKAWDSFHSALQIDPEVFDGKGHFRIGDPTPSAQLGAMNYYLAKSYIVAGMPDRAVEYLRMAMDEGYTDRKKVMADKEFSSLRDFPAFQQLLTEHRTQ
jgi:tetratricopeptide (TPR) repeat protein